MDQGIGVVVNDVAAVNIDAQLIQRHSPWCLVGNGGRATSIGIHSCIPEGAQEAGIQQKGAFFVQVVAQKAVPSWIPVSV